MLRVTNLSFSFSDKPLYEGVNFIVGKGQKIGLVGPNGSGKSTLFNILLGKEDGYKGKVKVGGNVVLVPQEVKYDPVMENSSSIRDYIDSENKYQDHELLKMLSGLQLNLNLENDAKNLSGGQKTKLALARALLQQADILLLDEPTNFMDDAGKKWVMDFLSNYEGTLVVISHDIHLMDKTIDKVLSINPVTRKIEEYKGNYSAYLKLKKEKERLLAKQILIKQKHIKQMEKGLQKMSRFTSGKGVRKKTQQRRRIEKEKKQLPELPREIRSIRIKLPEPTRAGEIPLRAVNVNKSFGNLQVLNDLTLSLRRGERIAFIGPNGVGKSTLIKILVGILNPDSGEVIIDDRTNIGYYSQEFELFDFNKNVLDTFTQTTKNNEGFARSFLGRFMFSGDKVYQRVSLLSGGEKTRLSIAVLTGRNHNLLILDEPTTYLDVTSQRIILEALKDYKGTMIIVSHTPEFVKELLPQRALLFPEGKIVYWENNLLEKVEEI